MTRRLIDDRTASPAFCIDKTLWGYVIRGTGGPPLLLQFAQGAVLACGAGFAAAALVLLEHGQGLEVTRMGLALVLSSVSLLMMWFATRGGLVELHLDLTRGELRELVRHRVGRATVVGRHGLADGATLAVDRPGPTGSPCSLILRLRGGTGDLCIAQGSLEAIQDLRRRLDPELRLCGRSGGPGPAPA